MVKNNQLDNDTIFVPKRPEKLCEVPIWEKNYLSIEEAAAYSGIGRTKVRELMERKECSFVIWVNGKRFIIREKFDKFLEKQVML